MCWTPFFFSILLFLPTVLFGQDTLRHRADTSIIYETVPIEEEPAFAGGVQGEERYLKDNLVIPKKIKQKEQLIRVEIAVEFLINETGKVVDLKITEASLHFFKDGLANSESLLSNREFIARAKKAFETMPPWMPARYNGRKTSKRIKQRFAWGKSGEWFVPTN